MLDALPLGFVLVGLGLYVVLGGADFGAGLWQLLGGHEPQASRIREQAHRSMAPVWEANHVWLIFVITVAWTAYPVAFGSIASTLALPLLVAGIGVVLRGAAYALRVGADDEREASHIDVVFAVSSILTPFALGTVVGAVVTGRVPVGNAAGDLGSSWTSATSIAVGLLAVATSAHLAAVFLAADAARRRDHALEHAFRRRALASGVVAGTLALVALVALRADAREVFDALVTGPAVACVGVSAVAGITTLALVRGGRLETARYTAAAAVGSVLAGWAVAQWPVVLPGLTVTQAAAPRGTLVALTLAIVIGGLVVLPALILLFRLALGGRLLEEEHGRVVGSASPPAAPAAAPRRVRAAAVLLLAVGSGLLTIASPGWAQAVGVVSLLAAVPVGAAAVLPNLLDDEPRSSGTWSG